MLVAGSLVGLSSAVSAHQGTGSAYGEQVTVALSSALANGNVNSGPLPTVSGSTTTTPFNQSSSVLSVNAATSLAVSPLLGTVNLGVLQTGLLEVNTQGTSTPTVTSDATVNNVDLSLLSSILPALPPLFGLTASEIVATASASGSCGTGVTTSGSTSMVNANMSGSIAGSASVLASPPANYQLVNVNLGVLGQLTVTLNEQTQTGDGVTSAGIEVNAVHVEASGLSLAGLIDIDADIVIGHAEASVTCFGVPSPPPPPPGTGVPLAGPPIRVPIGPWASMLAALILGVAAARYLRR